MDLTPAIIAADFADVVDNLQTVIFQRRTGDATWDTPGVLVTAALRRMPITRGTDLPEGGHVDTETVEFHLLASEVVSSDPDVTGTIVPSHGDRLVEGQTEWLVEQLDEGAFYWLVEDVDVAAWGTRYKVLCRKFVR